MHKLRSVLRAAGDRALVAEYGDHIELHVHRQVLALTAGLDRRSPEGMLEAIPTYRSVLIRYEPDVLALRQLIGLIRDVELQLEGAGLDREVDTPAPSSRLIEVPTFYGEEHGPDLDDVAAYTGLRPSEVIERHAAITYRVYMLGFMPGFCYLGDLPPALSIPRLSTPRLSVPAGSVGIGGVQTGIYSVRGPGGWRVIGRTAMRLWDPETDPPTVLGPGDRVRFVSVDPSEGR